MILIYEVVCNHIQNSASRVRQYQPNNLLVGQCLCPKLVHLFRAETSESVFEKSGVPVTSSGPRVGLSQFAAVDEGTSAVDKVLVEPLTILISHLHIQIEKIGFKCLVSFFFCEGKTKQEPLQQGAGNYPIKISR